MVRLSILHPFSHFNRMEIVPELSSRLSRLVCKVRRAAGLRWAGVALKRGREDTAAARVLVRVRAWAREGFWNFGCGRLCCWREGASGVCDGCRRQRTQGEQASGILRLRGAMMLAREGFKNPAAAKGQRTRRSTPGGPGMGGVEWT